MNLESLRARWLRRSLPALFLGTAVFAASADVSERPAPPAARAPLAPIAPIAPVAPPAPIGPLASELAGLGPHEFGHLMDSLRSLESLSSLRELERLSELTTMIDVEGIEEAMQSAMGDADVTISRFALNHGGDASGPEINETRPLKSNGRVSVNNVSGIVQVAVWDRNEVSIGGRLGTAQDRLEIAGDSNELNVLVRLPRGSRSGSDTVLELRVPMNARVELETVSADVVVSGTKGPVKVNTVSGDIALSLASSEVAVQTVSGDLKLKAPSARSTRVNSISGDVRLEGMSGALSLETVSGSVDLQRGGRFSEIRLKSISGDMNLDVGLTEDAKVSGQTLSGEITMIVPQAQTGTALLKSFSGDAHCEGAKTVENHGGKKRQYVWGDGHGAQIELSSFSGDIRVERK